MWKEPRLAESDPVLDSFLAILARDLTEHPAKIKPLDAATAKRIKRLTKGVKAEMDEDLGEGPSLLSRSGGQSRKSKS
jgi:hypothetical protein